MPGQWVEDSSYRSGWRWDSRSPDPDPNPTHILSAYAGGPSMADSDSYRRDVFDPRIGADGGGHAGGDSLPTIDPNRPVSHVDELTDVEDVAHQQGPLDHGELVACPTCGTGVHPDRIR